MIIIATGHNPPAIRRKGHGEDPISMAPQSQQFAPAHRLPHPGRIIMTASNNALAIRWAAGTGLEATNGSRAGLAEAVESFGGVGR